MNSFKIKNSMDSNWEGVSKNIHRLCIEILKRGPIPQHVAFIMDGNRRFAKKLGVPTNIGHSLGFNSLEKILECCLELGVKAVTVYAFSIDNFKRSEDEVSALMELAKDRLKWLANQTDLIDKYQVAIRVIGKLSLLPPDVRQVVNETNRSTSHHKGAILNVCFPYTSTEETITSIQNILKKHDDNEISSKQININSNELVHDNLYTSDCPPLDILVRTSGEIRLSDFMLWQSSKNCQLEFLNVLWPEFSLRHLLPVILNYQSNKLKTPNTIVVLAELTIISIIIYLIYIYFN